MADTADTSTRSTLAFHLILYAVAATALAFTPHVHRLHTSDSLIPVLASLYAWEPFYWGQDRVGMIWPLLAAPVTNPFTNLIAQSAIVIFCTLTVPLLLGVILIRQPGAVPLAAGLVNVWSLYTYPDLIFQNHYISSYYSSALMIGCLGMLLLKPGGRLWRLIAAGFLLVIAHWVYLAVTFFLIPMTFIRGWLNPGDRDRWWLLRPVTDPVSRAGLLLCLAAFGIGLGLMNGVAKGVRTPSEALPLNKWMETAEQLLKAPTRLASSETWLRGLAWAFAGGGVACAIFYRRAGWAIPTAVALIAAGIVECAAMATRQWTAINQYHPRYILGTCSAFHLATAVLVAAPFASWAAGWGRWVVLLGIATGLIAIIPARYGIPSATEVRSVHRELFGRYTDDVIQANADVLAGDYWTVWPAILQINALRHERGEPPILGIAQRGSPWRMRWVPPDRPIRVAIPRDQRQAAEDNRVVGCLAPFTHVEDFPTIEVYTTTPALP